MFLMSERNPEFDKPKSERSTAVQEHRAQGTAISRKIVQITQKGQELRQEGRYHDASMVEAQVGNLFYHCSTWPPFQAIGPT